MPVVRAMDRAVWRSGFTNRRQLVKLGYSMPKSAWLEHARVRVKRWRERRNVGRPSKRDDPGLIKFVRGVLIQNSTPSSVTCVLKRKDKDGTAKRVRRRVRALNCYLSSLYHSSADIAAKMKETQFRAIVRRHCKEFRRGRRLTDMCDHCAVYKQKLVPRAREFLGRVFSEMEAVCPSYWSPVHANEATAAGLGGTDMLQKLELVRSYLEVKHERQRQSIRRRAPTPALIRHSEGRLLKELKLRTKILAAYDWHVLSAAREQASMRRTIRDLPLRTAYYHADYCENVPIPMAHHETSCLAASLYGVSFPPNRSCPTLESKLTGHDCLVCQMCALQVTCGTGRRGRRSASTVLTLSTAVVASLRRSSSSTFLR